MHARTLLGFGAALAGVLLFASAGVAQDQAPAGGDHANGRGCMKGAMRQLNLSDDQKAKLKEIREGAQAGPDRREAIAKILTSEQRDKLRDLRKQCESQPQG